ncbi:hypothetical protein [Halobellus marinus]|uniref:hypothetical protein n=1 Tax=Halobellus marinus TaxID=3075123 RepID=UPI0028A72B6D|nr:hypothetical protein [Halobellus sp. DFY28]
MREIGQDPGQYRTAAELTADTRQQLSSRLAERETMVLSLGRATDGSGTQFALVHVPDHLDDFFIDERAFRPDERETVDYTAEGDDTLALGQEVQDMLEVYRSLPTFSETGFLNFALSTGLFPERSISTLHRSALLRRPSRPASISNSEPHPDRPTILHHNDGQIEIDALVMTRRNGERVLLVIEAMCGGRRNLAKHKLGYPALAAETSLSLDVDRVIPVYLRARPVKEGVRYSIYECSEIPTGEERPCLAKLHVVDDSHYEVRI